MLLVIVVLLFVFVLFRLVGGHPLAHFDVPSPELLTDLGAVLQQSLVYMYTIF